MIVYGDIGILGSISVLVELLHPHFVVVDTHSCPQDRL